jgi:hypothetical protein
MSSDYDVIVGGASPGKDCAGAHPIKHRADDTGDARSQGNPEGSGVVSWLFLPADRTAVAGSALVIAVGPWCAIAIRLHGILYQEKFGIFWRFFPKCRKPSDQKQLATALRH